MPMANNAASTWPTRRVVRGSQKSEQGSASTIPREVASIPSAGSRRYSFDHATIPNSTNMFANGHASMPTSSVTVSATVNTRTPMMAPGLTGDDSNRSRSARVYSTCTMQFRPRDSMNKKQKASPIVANKEGR